MATKLPLHTSVASASYRRRRCFIVIRGQIRGATLEMFANLCYNKDTQKGGVKQMTEMNMDFFKQFHIGTYYLQENARTEKHIKELAGRAIEIYPAN